LGLTTNWGSGGAQNRSFIIHYFAVAGSNEGSSLQWPDAAAGSTYGHCNMHNGMFFNDSRISNSSLLDGTAATAMVCETWGRTSIGHNASGESSRSMNLHAVVYFGYTPNSNHSSPWRANSFHPGGVQVAKADGSVSFVTDTIQHAAWQAMATIHGGE
jgi:prepilin-type processing-associated H-X9-DG protein